MTKQGLGNLIPNGFPTNDFNKTGSLVREIVESKNLFDISTLFPDSWMGSCYRFITATTHNDNFRNFMMNPDTEYPQINHYKQEKEIFGFFVNCLSSIECLYVSCYLVARIFNANSFPIDNFKKITILYTYQKFQQNFPSDNITKSLATIIEDKRFVDLKFIRNYQAHRMLMQQQHEIKIFPPQSPAALPKITWIAGKIKIETDTLTEYQSWVINSARTIFIDLEKFLNQRG